MPLRLLQPARDHFHLAKQQSRQCLALNGARPFGDAEQLPREEAMASYPHRPRDLGEAAQGRGYPSATYLTRL